ncbi:MAG: hypothetical protein NVS3B5_01620 [Sphingomicrobium sp.]
MTVYYNEIDPYAAQWLRNLIDAGHIAPGDVDERSIVDVSADELRGYAQCHFFAGIGGWSRALRLAQWGDDRRVWTGSCPCQPLSVAGQRQGHADERHLWPAFYSLIAECSPTIVFGEQVASEDGREWLAGIRADLEVLGYACGASDLCAAGIGAPQIRQRIYWMADRSSIGPWAAQSGDSAAEAEIRRAHPTSSYRRFTDGFGNCYRIPEPDVPFVVNGFPNILGRIRAAGNAIDPHLAAHFIAAGEEAMMGINGAVGNAQPSPAEHPQAQGKT